MEKFYNTNLEEYETQIVIDYYKRITTLYTSSKSIYDKYIKKLGTPAKTYYTKKQISGASWEVPFCDKIRSGYIFSRPSLIGNRK